MGEPNKIRPKVFFSGNFTANPSTINNRNFCYWHAKRWATNDWAPEDYIQFLKGIDLAT